MANREDNSTDQQYSRYVQGGLTDRYNNRLGWWERRLLPMRIDDYVITIKDSERRRPDLVSLRVYGTEKYAWLVLQYNTIVDVEEELIPGKIIKLPSQVRLMIDILNQQTGGNRV